jgi:hypothetical protein
MVEAIPALAMIPFSRPLVPSDPKAPSPAEELASVRTKRSKRKEREPISFRLTKVVEFGDEPFRASDDEVGETNGDGSENADDCNTMSEDDNRMKMTMKPRRGSHLHQHHG